MKKRNKQRAPINTENTTQFDPASGPTRSELQFKYKYPLSRPRPTGQLKILHLKHSLPANAPSIAARGDDDLMSQKQTQS